MSRNISNYHGHKVEWRVQGPFRKVYMRTGNKPWKFVGELQEGKSVSQYFESYLRNVGVLGP